MARIGGRNRWIAVPAGILCAGVVAGLVWLSLPMLPASVAWVDDTARSALSRSLLAPPTAPAAPSLEHDLECSTIYPADLWTELVWTPRALLSQTAAPPATSAASLVDALAPTVRITCAWRGDEGAKTISTTLAKVGSDAGALADVALRGAGFTCGAVPGGVECVLERGDVIEEHVVRDGYWLATVETAWHPERYGARISAYLFG